MSKSSRTRTTPSFRGIQPSSRRALNRTYRLSLVLHEQSEPVDFQSTRQVVGPNSRKLIDRLSTQESIGIHDCLIDHELLVTADKQGLKHSQRITSLPGITDVFQADFADVSLSYHFIVKSEVEGSSWRLG